MPRERKFKENTQPILIYQMGKVGSTAILLALQKTHPAVFHIHSLNATRLQKSTRILIDKGLGLPRHLTQSKQIIDGYLAKKRPLKIITPIRSPFDRNISAFFQDLSTRIIIRDDLRVGLNISANIKKIALLPIPNEFKNAIVERLTKNKISRHVDFLVHYFISNFQHRFSLDWFDNELKPSIDIDVYKSPFDLSQGFQYYKKNNLELLVIKSELPNKMKTKIISDFLGYSISQINDQHQSFNKIYSSTLKEFKLKLELDNLFPNMIRESRYVQTFYPELIDRLSI